MTEAMLAASLSLPKGPVSPEVHPDRTVTFRVCAPRAQHVALGEDHILLALGSPGQPIPFARGADGVWTLTAGPLEPDLYDYHILLDGVQIADPANTRVKAGAIPPSSQVKVPGDAPLYFDAQDVPHGVVHRHTYRSRVAGDFREVYVYTPPGYETAREPLPILYLLHGAGEVASGWSGIGAANLIADNLLAAGCARPMLIAMPHGHVLENVLDDFPVRLVQNVWLFQQDLLEDVIPLVEAAYRVRAGRKHRAIAGLSMGAMQAEIVGLSNLDRFSAIGLFSGGLPNLADLVPGVAAQPERANAALSDFFIGTGEQDELVLPFITELRGELDRLGIRYRYFAMPGGHTWTIWRHVLYHEWLPHLW